MIKIVQNLIFQNKSKIFLRSQAQFYIFKEIQSNVQINIKNNNIIRLTNRNYAGIDKHGWEQETDMGK